MILLKQYVIAIERLRDVGIANNEDGNDDYDDDDGGDDDYDWESGGGAILLCSRG